MNKLLEQFGNEKRFVNWRLLKVKGKLTKIPYATTGLKASSTDPATWSTYSEAKKYSENVGIVFMPDRLLLGIDIDHCLDKNGDLSHADQDIIEALLLKADTYTEVSPSKTGLHLFLKLTEPLDLTAHKKAPFELYNHGRYFTFTGEIFGSKERAVRTVSPEEVLAILMTVGYPWAKQETEKTAEKKSAAPLSLSDAQILEKMFSSKNGAAIRALWDGDASAYNNDMSSADMALCAHLAFWAGKDSVQIERLWLSSALGARTKTAKRADYRARTVANAVARCNETYAPSKEKEQVRVADTELDLDLLYTINSKKDKVYTQNTENMCRIMRKHPDFIGRLRFDCFKSNFEIMEKGKWRGVENGDDIDIQTRISILFPYFGKVSKEMIYDAMVKVSRDNQIDSAADFIRSIKWDGEKRLDNWLTSTYGTPVDEYHTSVASNWIKGLVKRIIVPGCKFDYVLVLEGEQGTKKSTSLNVLGGDWHVETTMGTDSKDFFMQFAGKAIIEFSEGETMSRTEIKKMKAIITTQVDRYRPPWGKTSQDFPRRCVFAMTTNQTEYLKDETGNRRWLPITVMLPEANIEWLAQFRDQLFAEAYHRLFVDKESIYEFPLEETRRMQQERRIHDPNADVIEDWYFNVLSSEQRESGVTVSQVYRYAIHGGMQSKPMERWNEMSIADVLKSTLKLIKTRQMKGGARQWVWLPPEMTLHLAVEDKKKEAPLKAKAVFGKGIVKPTPAKEPDKDVEGIMKSLEGKF